MTFKVAYCAGHSKYDTPGKQSPDGEKEWEFNDKVARAFALELSNYEDVELRRFDDPTGRVDIPLQERTNAANKWGADVYISFHHNAFRGAWGNHTGVETFTYLGSQPKSEELAALVNPAIVKAYGLFDRGIKKANLHIVRETDMPSILIEGGFFDSLIDIKKLRDDNVLRNAGIGVAKAVAQYGNLKEKPSIPPFWDGSLMKRGQIGRIRILNHINLWKRDENNKLHFVRILQPGETYRVYGYDDLYFGQYNVGGSHYITKMEGYVRYETPSKRVLELCKEYYK